MRTQEGGRAKYDHHLTFGKMMHVHRQGEKYLQPHKSPLLTIVARLPGTAT